MWSLARVQDLGKDEQETVDLSPCPYGRDGQKDQEFICITNFAYFYCQNHGNGFYHLEVQYFDLSL